MSNESKLDVLAAMDEADACLLLDGRDVAANELTKARDAVANLIDFKIATLRVLTGMPPVLEAIHCEAAARALGRNGGYK